MEKKKLTNAQLERRMNDAVVFVPRDKSCKEIYFDDKGLRLQVTDDYCVISTLAHRHVFDKIAGMGYSRSYLYAQRFVDIALANDCTVKDKNGNPVGHSYGLLMEVLKNKEDKTEFNIATYVDWWMFNIFQPLYSIDDNAAAQWLVYFNYMHNIAINAIILGERDADMTNTEFAEQYAKTMKEFVGGIEPNVILKKETKDEADAKEIKAIAEQETEQAAKESAENDG